MYDLWHLGKVAQIAKWRFPVQISIERRPFHFTQNAETAQREQIQGCLNVIGERLASVMRRDEDDQARLKAGREAIRTEMTSMGTARQARQAYVTTPATSSAVNNRFADRHG